MRVLYEADEAAGERGPLLSHTIENVKRMGLAVVETFGSEEDGTLGVCKVAIPERAVKLWHDDIRRPPDDSWVWARTNDDAKLVFSAREVTECSLDHDLGLHDHDPDVPDADIQIGWDEENDGLGLVKWMVENNRVPPIVTIHSHNPDGAKRMAQAIVESGQANKIIVKRFFR